MMLQYIILFLVLVSINSFGASKIADLKYEQNLSEQVFDEKAQKGSKLVKYLTHTKKAEEYIKDILESEKIYPALHNEILSYVVKPYKYLKTLPSKHSRRVYILNNLQDGKLISSDGEKIKIWDTNTDNFVEIDSTIDYSNAELLCLLTNGNLAVSTYSKKVKIWNLSDGNSLKIPTNHTSWIRSINSLHNGNLVTSSYDGTLKVWDVKTGRCLHVLAGHKDRITCVCILLNGHIASGSYDQAIRIWNPDTGECIHVLKGHSSRITSMCALPDGNLASSSGAYDRSIKIWDINTGDCLRTMIPYWTVEELLISPDKKLLSRSFLFTEIKFWDINTGEYIQDLFGPVMLSKFHFFQDSNYFGALTGSKEMIIWNLNNPNYIQTIKSDCGIPIESMHTLPSGHLILGLDDGTIEVWHKVLDFEGS